MSKMQRPQAQATATGQEKKTAATGQAQGNGHRLKDAAATGQATATGTRCATAFQTCAMHSYGAMVSTGCIPYGVVCAPRKTLPNQKGVPRAPARVGR